MTVSINHLPFSFANKFRVFADPETTPITVFYEQQLSANCLKEVRRVLTEPFVLEKLPEEEFTARMAKAFQGSSDEARQLMNDIGSDEELRALADQLPDSEDLLEADDGAPIIRMINAMLSESIREGASDIHVETFEQYVSIRFRIDGVLREILKPQKKLSSLLVSRIKVMAKLDIAEKRIPQDGRISLKLGGKAVDVRVSTLPTRHGERIVMRLLDRSSIRFSLDTLGMSERVCEGFRGCLEKPHGILLVTGPTGSGKSTTLYSGISEMNQPGRNIMTVEDPVEFDLEGIGQTQVNAKVDMTFARGLRAMLRQDPDVVMVGEIRDLETAEIAVQASLTGHLVLSTLHTNTAVGAITRMRDMGIEPFLLASSLLGVLAQRLVRTLCPSCREPTEPAPSEQKILGLGAEDQRHIWRPKGCPDCRHSGYRGRIGLYEFFLVDEETRQLIHEGKGEPGLQKHIRNAWPAIQQDGFDKVMSGVTSLSEVLRVTREQ